MFISSGKRGVGEVEEEDQFVQGCCKVRGLFFCLQSSQQIKSKRGKAQIDILLLVQYTNEGKLFLIKVSDATPPLIKSPFDTGVPVEFMQYAQKRVHSTLPYKSFFFYVRALISCVNIFPLDFPRQYNGSNQHFPGPKSPPPIIHKRKTSIFQR